MARLALLLPVLALLLAACGSDGGGEAAPSDETSSETRQTATEPPETTTEEEPAISEECRAELEPFLEALQDIDARLDIGLNYDEYTDRVGDVSVAYDRIDVGMLEPGSCLAAAAQAEKAFNQYIKASTTWDDCFEDIDCELDSIEPRLQKLWAQATRLRERADARLESG